MTTDKGAGLTILYDQECDELLIAHGLPCTDVARDCVRAAYATGRMHQHAAGLAARAEGVPVACPPREPTPEMVDAGFRTFKGAGWLSIDAIHLWRSMYDAAPAPAPDAIQAAFDRGYTAAMNDVQAYSSKPAPERMASGIVIPPNGPESTTYTRQSAPAPDDGGEQQMWDAVEEIERAPAPAPDKEKP